jgi:hypothetical protein
VPHSYGTGDRYVEAKESAAPSVKAEEKHPSGAIRRIATQRG